MKKKSGKRISYTFIGAAAGVLPLLLRILAAVSAFLAVLLLIIVPIVAIVNPSSPSELILPPSMSTVTDSAGETVSYTLRIGDGIAVSRAAGEVTVSDIKTAIYGSLVRAAAAFAVLAPVFGFLARIFANIRKGIVMDRKNADLMSFIGITVFVGSIVISAIDRWFNYTLVKVFLGTDGNVSYSFGISTYGVLVALFVLLIALIFGYAASRNENTAAGSEDGAVVQSGTQEDTKED